MIYHGIAIMVCAGLALAGVLYQLHHLAIAGFHDAAMHDPLAAPTTWVERRHLRKRCGTCSLIAELAVAHATPVR